MFYKLQSDTVTDENAQAFTELNYTNENDKTIDLPLDTKKIDFDFVFFE